MIGVRGHQRLFEETLSNLREGGSGKPVIIGSHTKAVDPIFSENSDKIGMMGRDVAGDVVRFYTIMDGIREDIKGLADGEIDQFSRETRIRLIEEDLRLRSEAKKIFEKLTKAL